MPKRPSSHRTPPGWSWTFHSDDGLTVASKKIQMQVQALADDVLRFRLAPPGAGPFPASWVVPKECSQPFTRPPIVRITANALEFATDAATWRLRLNTGTWGIQDGFGWSVFESGRSPWSLIGGQCEMALQLAPREAVFGLGETAGTFNRRGTVREFWNSDVLGHAPCIHPHLKSLYVSIPFALSLHDGRAAGLFWDFPGRQTWDVGSTDRDLWTLKADAEGADLYLFTGPTPRGVVERFTALTGRHSLLPRWALGYHQSRYSYTTRGELESVAREFRRRQIPCDALYCDIDHQHGHRVFTFGRSFPRPAEMIAKLRRQGFRVVAIANPGVKDDPRFGVLRRGRARDAFVRQPKGRGDFVGRVWPGPARFPDFTRGDVREWWASEQRAFLKLGLAGIWNDMNEPAVFDRPDKTLDPQCRHQSDLGPRRHAEIHNLYGQLMAAASQLGMRPAPASRIPPDQQPRPFVITRAGYAGIQRHALVWTGDNSSSWTHLDDAVQMLLNLGLSGVGFCGADVGGFLENCPAELFVRWLQMAVFTPFLRNHSNIGTARQEPWAFGPEVEAINRRYLNLRYQLLPYLYGLLAENALSGTPMMRPLFWHYPNDPTAAACGDQFLLGQSLLVAPVLRPGAEARSVYLPRGEWYDFWTGQLHAGGGHLAARAPLDVIPLYIKAGALLPLAPIRASVADHEPSTIYLHVWPRDDGALDWYDDDGQSMAHEQGIWHRRRIIHESRGRGGRLRWEAAAGDFPSSTRTWRLVLRGISRPLRVTVNGERVDAPFDEALGLVIFDVPRCDQEFTVAWK
ncbi:MAG: DUF5110 domain-containing protein [Verrucomicrobiales bacterium]|nr:DUF5110 domain-containing protein [Verrucomicrobiales bacterium]